MRLEPPCVSKEARAAGWAGIPHGGFVILGMDAHLIPWNPLYQLQHGPHYFIVRKSAGDPQICFDPTYGLSGQTLEVSVLLSGSYALIPVQSTEAPAVLTHKGDPLLAQARNVLEQHSGTLQRFFRNAEAWIVSAGESALLPAKYVDALLTGRYLFRRFLEVRYAAPKRACLFQDKYYFAEWKAVKNGFFKAALATRHCAVFGEACSRLYALFEQETALAEQILAHEK